MSDTDDGFDEEAVRRELREKYENDDRAETERMSELLLQGATMTNQHCDNCGTPVFRYEGQAFCPNCQYEYEQAQGGQTGQPEGGQAGQLEGGQAGQREGGQAGQPPANQPEQVQDDEPARAQRGNRTRPQREQPPDAEDARADDRTQPASSGGDVGGEAPPASGADAAPGGERAAPATSGEAADALESSVAALARRAAGSDDPRRAREYLEAAREAAEALAALHRNE